MDRRTIRLALSAALLVALPFAAVQADSGKGQGKERRGGWEQREPRDQVVRGLADRGAHVPPGHLPPPGQCRRWKPGVPPGHQPAPVPCERLTASSVRPGEVILDHSGAYDPAGEWEEIERERPGAVPERILDLFEEIILREL